MDQFVLQKLRVENYRNLNPSVIEFSEGINCIFGKNGNGKTNLLEAIHYILNRKSFRKNTSFEQLISVECEQPEIIFSSLFSFNEKFIPLSGKISSESSEWYLDNKSTKKKIGLESVFINPFDSFSFHTSASFRRSWFDTYLGIISKEYKKTLSQFNSSLRFRNQLLSKKPNAFREQIMANNPNLAHLSFQLIRMRKIFLKELKDYCALTFKIIFDEVHNLEIILDSKFEGYSEQDILNYYNESLQKDEIIGHTRTGVQRDDYVFQFDGYNSYEYCSLGQQKMSFLSLIFAYIELFRYKFKTYPMVLMDDVSGELDSTRWKNLINYLQAKKFQVLITTANDNFKKELERIQNAKKIYIQDGSIQEY